jgi:hypothetical protein
MNRADIHNGGFRSRSAHASYQTATAGGTGDATEADGAYADRFDSASGMAMSAKLIIGFTATLAQAATLTIAANIQDDADGSGAGVDYGDALTATVVATGGTGGSTERGTIEIDFDLSSAERYVRSQITPNLSAANTDTCVVWAVWVFYGAGNSPITKSLI